MYVKVDFISIGQVELWGTQRAQKCQITARTEWYSMPLPPAY